MVGGFFDRVRPRPDELKPGTIRPYYHQLAVIGNGFDLECGLASKYEDFFVPRHEAIQTQNWRETGRLEGLGYDASPTAWDFLLASQCYAPWYCVEDAIRDLVLSATDSGRITTGLSARLIDRINNPSASLSSPAGGDGDEKVIAEVIDYISHDRETDRPADGQQWTYQDYTGFLGSQLRKLEANFSAYLSPISEQDKGYIDRAYTLMKQILLEDLPESGFYEYGATLLSFNYTNPFKKKFGRMDDTRLMNVYGKTLENEDHGRNLMHKLMIEGRLQVKLLEGYDN